MSNNINIDVTYTDERGPHVVTPEIAAWIVQHGTPETAAETSQPAAQGDEAAVRMISASIRAALYRHASGDYNSSAQALAEDIVARRLIGVWAYWGREHPAVTIASLRAELEQAKRERLLIDHDPPVCRLQLHDGRVPCNARQAAEMWKAECDRAITELAEVRIRCEELIASNQEHRRLLEAAKADLTIMTGQYEAANDTINECNAALARHGVHPGGDGHPRAGINELADRLATMTERAEKAEAKCPASMGAGDGAGSLFIHGTVEALHAARSWLDQRDAARAEAAQWKERAEKAERFEAVCHCGNLVSRHTAADGHSPVEMPWECPTERERNELRDEADKLAGLLQKWLSHHRMASTNPAPVNQTETALAAHNAGKDEP